VTLEGTGFTGRDVRESFVLAARLHPVELVLYDNRRDAQQALANVADAIARRVDLYVQYFDDAATNAEAAARLRQARIPVLAINYPVPGASFYGADNHEAGRLAGEALGDFGVRTWRGQAMAAALIGPATSGPAVERGRGVAAGLKSRLPSVPMTSLDTRGNPAQVAGLLGRFLTAHPRSKLLIAALDDTTALAAKGAVETAGRLADAAIVSHGMDRTMHGGVNDRKEIDPGNRGSIVIGSVAFYLDRYGEDILPLTLRMLRGEPVAARTTTRHLLITAANVFREYPPYDMN
jgi:ribose transport system substrate-binding protein